MSRGESIRQRLPRPLKRIYRRAFPEDTLQPDWTKLLGPDWRQHAAPARGARVLIGTSVGVHSYTKLDSLLAAALTLRGAEVHVLLCDQALPACMKCSMTALGSAENLVRRGPRGELECRSCYPDAERMYRRLGVRVHRYSDYVTREDRRQCEELARSLPVTEVGRCVLDDIPVGLHAQAGAIRFFGGLLEREPMAEPVLRKYFLASLLTKAAAERLFRTVGFRAAVFHHGIYVPQGITSAIARREEAAVATWMAAYRRSSFIFSHRDTYHHTLMTEPVANWEGMNWTESMEAELLDYLRSRWDGSRDWISFNREPEFDVPAIERETEIDFSRTTVGLLTNVMWDAQLHYPANAFPSMLHWLYATIRHFAARPDLQLVIRVHPAELKGTIRSRQPVTEEIRREFRDLPGNVFIIPPESRISTYPVMLQCDSVLIYGTKTGVELSSLGVPIVVAGEAWIRNKGITIDPTSEADYLSILEGLPVGRRLDEATTRRARMYAYHFFYRRMIPVKAMQQAAIAGQGQYEIRLDGARDLQPGRDLGLDVICDGILDGREFIYPAEQVGASEERALTLQQVQ